MAQPSPSRDSHVRFPSAHLCVIIQGVVKAAAASQHAPPRLEVGLAVAGSPGRPVIMACDTRR